MPFKYDSPVERIIANSVLSVDSAYAGSWCWVWTGSTTTNRDGTHYAAITRRGKNGRLKGKVIKDKAHRYVVRFVQGRTLSKRQVVLHLCNNTLCVNPEHLAGGTQKANMRQCVREGRHVSGFSRA